MIQLTPRLAAIANEIEKGETMADIGTDHGFLPVALWEQGVCPKVILADVNQGPLDRAKSNGAESHPGVEFDCRLGDGLKVIEPGEVDVIVIAGMGGTLMTEILGEDIEKTWSYKKLVLQPRKDIGELRHWIYNNCMSISNEKLVREGRYIWPILTVVPIEKACLGDLGPERIEWEYPRRLLDFLNPLTEEYLGMKLKLEEEILENMEKGEQTGPAMQNQKNRVRYIKELIRDVKKALDSTSAEG
ncbi:MAG: SAM-dependent methyltransferase [Firmicutes bacterium]|nr:SAM-dependent methyltransferase [Bacillota bacterium]